MKNQNTFPTEYEMTLARLYAAFKPNSKLRCSSGKELGDASRNQSIETFLSELRHLIEESKSLPHAA